MWAILKDHAENGIEEAVLIGRVMAKGISEELARSSFDKANEDSRVFCMNGDVWPLFNWLRKKFFMILLWNLCVERRLLNK